LRNPISQLNFLFFSTLMAILIWMASPGVKAESFPFAAYEARYAILWHGVKAGESTHKLNHHKNGQYYFETRTDPNIPLVPYHHFESSTFSWENGAIKPQHYEFDIKEGKRHKVGNVFFNWKNRTVRNNRKPEPWHTTLQDGMQDKITQTFSLRSDLKKGINQLDYLVVESDKTKDYHFVILGSERLRTKLGLLDTIKLKHTSKKGYETLMWLAIKLDYLPVKMQQTRHNKVVASGSIISLTPLIGESK
jgi:hypothetical protein